MKKPMYYHCSNSHWNTHHHHTCRNLLCSYPFHSLERMNLDLHNQCQNNQSNHRNHYPCHRNTILSVQIHYYCSKQKRHFRRCSQKKRKKFCLQHIHSHSRHLCPRSDSPQQTRIHHQDSTIFERRYTHNKAHHHLYSRPQFGMFAQNLSVHKLLKQKILKAAVQLLLLLPPSC